MKYFSLLQIQEAIKRLNPHHPIFSSTFFVLKKDQAPIGDKFRFALNSHNHAFMRDKYRVNPKSNWFFRVFGQRGRRNQDWLKPDYASKGLQKLITSTCKDVFLHDRNDNTWGFSKNYVRELKKFLPKNEKIPLFHIAVWFYKDQSWADDMSCKVIVNDFIRKYYITDTEIEELFDIGVSSEISENEAFQNAKVKWHQIIEPYEVPPDVPPSQSGILRYLEVEGVGPVEPLMFEPAQRLSIITGDNGLGKTFLLDLSWWALTQNWAERPAEPFPIRQNIIPKIKFLISNGAQTKPITVKFSNDSLEWEPPKKVSSIPGLVIYARVDGSFAIWDPINRAFSRKHSGDFTPSVVFSRNEVWNGKKDQIEGLLRDWVRWQERKDKYDVFNTFKKVLEKLSPPDLGPFKIGEPTRILGEVREIPTLIHPYGSVPIIFESAGIKRISTLAYLIVWAWEEHKIQAEQLDRTEERQMVILLDEAEAHLHPKWQRKIIPALMEISNCLHSEMSLQLILATHSPLIVASSETIFDPEKDKIFNLDLAMSGKVKFNQMNFELRGTVDSWLSSDFFGLQFPGNEKRSEILQKAISLQESDSVTRSEVENLSEQLKNLLSPEDPFWIRWIIYAEQFGVKI
jgi:hypothetical protein